MLKHHTLISAGLGLTFAVPVILGQEGDLKTRLAATVEALEELAGLRPAIASGDTLAIERLLEIGTKEVPLSQERDARLEGARLDVTRLAAQLEALEVADLAALTGDPSRTDLPPSTRVQAAVGTGAASLAQRFEDPGFSADPLREGRLLVRAARYEDALQALRRCADSEEKTWLVARAHLGLGQEGEALPLLRGLAESESASEPARWARQEVRMIELRQRLQQGRKGGRQ